MRTWEVTQIPFALLEIPDENIMFFFSLLKKIDVLFKYLRAEFTIGLSENALGVSDHSSVIQNSSALFCEDLFFS
jgi:hypothetical protein